MANETIAKANVRLTSGLNVLAGGWLIVAPWVMEYWEFAVAAWNDVIVGALVIVLAGVRVIMPTRVTGLSWVNVVLGSWLIVAPFILGYGAEAGAALWSDMILGVAIVFLGWLSVSSTRIQTR